MGHRQRYCSVRACQLARKSVYQSRWRAAHPAEERGRRLREALDRGEPTAPRPLEPLGFVPWDEIESELGLPTSVILKCVAGVLVRWLLASDITHRGSLTTAEARSAVAQSTARSDRETPAISGSGVA